MAIDTKKLREKRKTSKEELIEAKTAFEEEYKKLDVSDPE
jgi:hypothetical protein